MADAAGASDIQVEFILLPVAKVPGFDEWFAELLLELLVRAAQQLGHLGVHAFGDGGPRRGFGVRYPRLAFC